MDTIRFFLVEFINQTFDESRSEIHIYINGHNLIDLVQQIEYPTLDVQNLGSSSKWSYAGLNPEWCPGLREDLLGNSQSPYSVLLTCTCFQDGCNSVMAKIEVGDKTVIWKDFTSVLHGEQARSWGGRQVDYAGLGPFIFDRGQYVEELNALKLDQYG